MGCGCGSNFSGKSNFVNEEKPCTCGRNTSGSCQCNNNTNRIPDSRWQRPQGLGTNWNSSSSLMGGNVSQAMSAPLSASGTGKYPCRDIYGGLYYSDKPCVNEYGVAAKQAQGGVTPAARQSDFFICPKGKCWNGSKCVPCTNGNIDGARQGQGGTKPSAKQGGTLPPPPGPNAPIPIINFDDVYDKQGSNNNMKRKLHDNRKKFSSFMGKMRPKRKFNHFVDIKKHNISPEHYFEYNSRPFETLRRTTDSFKNYNDLRAMNYEL